jgi:diguanylate cyclase (GGDEF)-like protein
VADHLLLETVARIGQAVDRHVVGSAAVLEAAFPNGMAAPERIDDQLSALRTRFWIATSLHIDPNNYVYYGSRQGQFYGLWRDSLTDAELRIKLRPDEPRTLYRFSGFNGRVGPAVQETRMFEPRERPWYKTGQLNAAQAWTAIYIDFRRAELVATRARRVLNGQGGFEGVVATDLSLQRLNEFVRSLAVSPNAVAFIVETDGKLIASSRTANVRHGANGQNERVNAADSGNALQVAAQAQVQAVLLDGSVPVNAPRTLTFEGPDHGRVQLAFSRLRDSAGLDWITVVAVPRSDFMQGVTHNVLRTAGIAAVATALAIALGLLILAGVSRDLQRLAEAAREIGDGRIDVKLDIQRDDEIGALAHSFRRMQQRLRMDGLTGLANRDTIVRSIAQRIQQNRRAADAGTFAVLFIDLNRFKLVNDLHGHEAGDRVLVEIASRLRAATRSTDLVARYAGDEFVVLIDNLPDAQAAEQVRLSVEAALSQPLASVAMPGPGAPRLAGAVGLAVHPRDADTAEDLIGAADHDMYARKRAQQG